MVEKFLIGLTREEIWHIVTVMNERGISHCQFCKDLVIKLEEKLNL